MNVTQNRRQSQSEAAGDQPGAARFWGEFSRAGSRRAEDHGSRAAGDGAPAEPDPDDGPAGEPENGRPDPAAGGPSAGPGHGHGDDGCLEWCPICRSAELIRSAVTPELREQAEALQREATHIFRAFLTAYAERTGGTTADGHSARSSPSGPDPDREAGINDPPDDGPPGPGSDREVTEIPLD